MSDSPKYYVNTAHSSAIGDNATVYNQGDTVALADAFAQALGKLTSLSDDDREVAEPLVKQAQRKAEAIQAGDDSPEAESDLEQRLEKLLSVASDVGDVLLTSLTSPIGGIVLGVRKIAERVRARHQT